MIYTRELYTWTVRRPHETWGMHGGHWGGGRGGQRNRAPARVFHRQVRQPWRRRPWPDNLGARLATHKRALLISGIKATSLGGLLRDSLQANAKRTQSGRRQAWLNAVTSPNLRGDYVTPTWSAYISLQPYSLDRHWRPCSWNVRVHTTSSILYMVPVFSSTIAQF